LPNPVAQHTSPSAGTCHPQVSSANYSKAWR
jgi:hypothetical protein